MKNDDLNEHLDALHRELEQLSAGTPLDEERLRHLVGEVERRLEQPIESEPPEGLLDGLRSWAESLELEYPTLAAMVNRVMVTLGNTGI